MRPPGPWLPFLGQALIALAIGALGVTGLMWLIALVAELLT